MICNAKLTDVREIAVQTSTCRFSANIQAENPNSPLPLLFISATNLIIYDNSFNSIFRCSEPPNVFRTLSVFQRTASDWLLDVMHSERDLRTNSPKSRTIVSGSSDLSPSTTACASHPSEHMARFYSTDLKCRLHPDKYRSTKKTMNGVNCSDIHFIRLKRCICSNSGFIIWFIFVWWYL